MKPSTSYFVIHPRVQRARRIGKAVVALESTVITHGLPHPQNLELAMDMEAVVEQAGCVPATVAVYDGKIHIGLERDELEALARDTKARKISTRDFAAALRLGENGGTTVAATLHAARVAGLQVFATGGIGGVHREPPTDVSADLPQLARSPMIVVCAGAKAILDLPATLEYLETHAVPVLGYQTDEFPAFYSRESGLPVSLRFDSAQAIADYATTHWELGFQSAVLVAQPPSADTALPADAIERAIAQALADAREKGTRGPAVTPYLLERVAELTDSASVATNLALLKQNARLASEIAIALVGKSRRAIGYV